MRAFSCHSGEDTTLARQRALWQDAFTAIDAARASAGRNEALFHYHKAINLLDQALLLPSPPIHRYLPVGVYLWCKSFNTCFYSATSESMRSKIGETKAICEDKIRKVEAELHREAPPTYPKGSPQKTANNSSPVSKIMSFFGKSELPAQPQILPLEQPDVKEDNDLPQELVNDVADMKGSCLDESILDGKENTNNIKSDPKKRAHSLPASGPAINNTKKLPSSGTPTRPPLLSKNVGAKKTTTISSSSPLAKKASSHPKAPSTGVSASSSSPSVVKKRPSFSKMSSITNKEVSSKSNGIKGVQKQANLLEEVDASMVALIEKEIVDSGPSVTWNDVGMLLKRIINQHTLCATIPLSNRTCTHDNTVVH